MPYYTLIVNNEKKRVSANSKTPLLWILRENLELTGTKFGCGKGLCGACTIHYNGKAVPSCIMSVDSVMDGTITTIEGLSEMGDHPVQLAWREMDVPQCGYCQSGQIMTAAAMLSDKVSISDDDINTGMSRNICRCGTYARIRQAIKLAAGNLGMQTGVNEE